MNMYTRTHAHTHTHTLSLSLTHTHTLTRAHTLSLTDRHTHTHTARTLFPERQTTDDEAAVPGGEKGAGHAGGGERGGALAPGPSAAESTHQNAALLIPEQWGQELAGTHEKTKSQCPGTFTRQNSRRECAPECDVARARAVRRGAGRHQQKRKNEEEKMNKHFALTLAPREELVGTHTHTHTHTPRGREGGREGGRERERVCV